MSKNYKLNIKKSPVDERDYIAETIFAEGDVPLELDLRKDMQPVRDQGQQGTCAAMTSSAIKEWQERKDYGFNEYMSPQFIYNNRRNQDSSGMYSRDVMKILYEIGSVPEKDYPYETFTPISAELKMAAYKNHIQGYALVSSIDGLKRALVKSGPCYIAFPVYNYTNRMWKPRQGDTSLGGHAVTVVGYTTEGFILRNSWGDTWNGDGHTIFPFEDWGLHYEAWTVVDAESGEPLPPIDPVEPEPKPKKKGFWKKFMEWLSTVFD